MVSNTNALALLVDKINQNSCRLTKSLELADTSTPNIATKVDFDYTNEKLINIINKLASKQGINILFPSDLSKLDIEVSISLPNPITIVEAWQLVNNFLEIVGYLLVPKGVTYEIMPNKEVSREPLSTNINVHPESLPNNDQVVRYLYYFQNINLKSANSKSKANLETILKDMLPIAAGSSLGSLAKDSGVPPFAGYLFDSKANCLIITGKTSNIKSAMNIIMNLDSEGFREAIEVVPLKHTNAKTVCDLLNKVIQDKKSSTTYRYGSSSSDSSDSKEDELYFSKNTSIVPIDRNNSVAIMGKIDAVEKIKHFIIKYLDVAVDSGKSLIHIKELHHIDSGELAKVLQKIIRARTEGTQTSSQKDPLGDVIITSEQDEEIEKIEQLEIKKNGVGESPKSKPKKTGNGSAMTGNNCLVIAAREPEWQVLEKLIEEIDQPMEQVAIEALIIDLIVTDDNLLAAQTRNLNGTGVPQPADFQSAQIGTQTAQVNGSTGQLGGPVLDYIKTTVDGDTTYVPTPQGLAADLITAGKLTSAGTIEEQLVKIVNLTKRGSTLLSFSDGDGIASLLQVFSGYSNAKVLSQPFITTRNHQQAAMTSSAERLVPGAVQEQSVGGPAIIKQDIIAADLKIDILPRISHAGAINLEIIVHASEFKTESLLDNTILKRKIQTNANVSDKQVLVIGGLTRVISRDLSSGLPIISKIPILGSLFRRRNQVLEKSTLMVFISPKIIKPRAGINKFTKNKINEAMENIKVDELAFDNLADPITRILFKSQASEANAIISDFADQINFKEPSKNNGPILSKIK